MSKDVEVTASVFDDADCGLMRDALEFYREVSRRTVNLPSIGDRDRAACREVMAGTDRLLQLIPAPGRDLRHAPGCLAYAVPRERKH